MFVQFIVLCVLFLVLVKLMLVGWSGLTCGKQTLSLSLSLSMCLSLSRLTYVHTVAVVR